MKKHVELPTELWVIIMIYYVRYCVDSHKKYNKLSLAFCNKQMFSIFCKYKTNLLRWIPIWTSNRIVPLESLLCLKSSNTGTITTQGSKYLRKIRSLNTDDNEEGFNPFTKPQCFMYETRYWEPDTIYIKTHKESLFELTSSDIIDVHLYNLNSYLKTRTLVIEFADKKVLCLVMGNKETYAVYTEFYHLDGLKEYFTYRLYIDISTPATPHMKFNIQCINTYDVAYIINIVTQTRLCAIKNL